MLNRCVVVRPPVVDLVDFDGAARHDRLEVLHPGLLPPRHEPVRKAGIRGAVAPLADGRRRPLEHIEVPCRLGQRRHTLNATRPGADESDGLVRQPRQRLVPTSTGVLVVPSSSVERATRKGLHATDGRQLHKVEDPDRQHVPATRQLVAGPVGVDLPPGRVLVPLRAGHPGVEQPAGHKVVPVGDRLEVAQDLLAVGVAVCRDVVELLEHREVDIRLDVAHDAWVAVPVPGTPDAAGLVDDADPLNAGLAELNAGEDAGDPPAHDDDLDVIDDRVALDEWREGVV